jgi:hypothetical protein
MFRHTQTHRRGGEANEHNRFGGGVGVVVGHRSFHNKHCHPPHSSIVIATGAGCHNRRPITYHTRPSYPIISGLISFLILCTLIACVCAIPMAVAAQALIAIIIVGVALSTPIFCAHEAEVTYTMDF